MRIHGDFQHPDMRSGFKLLEVIEFYPTARTHEAQQTAIRHVEPVSDQTVFRQLLEHPLRKRTGLCTAMHGCVRRGCGSRY